jgi:hypothetical protein
LGKDGDYRAGVKFVEISAEDMDKLKDFLNTLINIKIPSELRVPSKFASTMADFSAPKPPKPK